MSDKVEICGFFCSKEYAEALNQELMFPTSFPEVETRVTKSRFTIGLENGKDVSFEKGEVVLYKLDSGKTVNAMIRGRAFKHSGYEDLLVYDAIFSDDGLQYCAIAEQIIGWRGKS